MSRWYVSYDENEKNRLTAELHRLLVTRGKFYTNFIEFRNYKIVYRRFKGLFIAMCIDLTDSELAHLEFIQLFVECLDQYFGNVKEVDLIFNFHKVYLLLDNIVVGGEIMETNKEKIMGEFLFFNF